jgi:hemerythrin
MFEWKPEYSVQIPEIDVQHRRLFALAADLYTALTQGKAYTVLEPCLASLLEYTKTHFAAEEALMRKYGYPQALAHKEQHDKLTAQVMNLQKRLRAGENTLSLSVMAFLKDWLEHHIAGSDQSYSAYIRGRRAA